MKRFALFASVLGVVVAGVMLQPRVAQGQAGKSSGLTLNLIGIAVSDYAKSQAFYERVLGFPAAFKFSSADGTRTNTFFQMSRNTFLEMQQATADVRPGLTHAHFAVDDLTATLARLRQAGLAAPPPNTAPAPWSDSSSDGGCSSAERTNYRAATEYFAARDRAAEFPPRLRLAECK